MRQSPTHRTAPEPATRRARRAPLVLGLLVVACAAPVLATGWNLTVDMSGSMSPAIEAGDVLVSHPVATSELTVGDVVTFDDVRHPGRTLTHRVVRLEHDGGTWDVTTRGDANTAAEQWTTASDHVPRVVARVPQVGRVLLPLTGLEGRLGLVLAGGGAVLCYLARAHR